MLKLVFLSVFVWTVEPANILGIFSSPNEDSFDIGSTLMAELAGKGHKVILVTGKYMVKDSNPNISYIYIDNDWEVAEKFSTNLMHRANMGFIRSTAWYFDSGYDVTSTLLSDHNFQYLLHSNQKFDLIIAEYCANEAILGVTKVFGAPIMLISSQPSSFLMTDMFASPAPASYVPNTLTDHTGVMSYMDRMHNFMCNVFSENYRYLIALPWQEKLLNVHIDAELSIGTAIENISMILLNSHPSITEPVPHTPNMVEIGGLHITPRMKLRDNIEKFIDDAKHGVIYFSMDPNLNERHLGNEKIEEMLATFSRLKQRIVWNFKDAPSFFPDNVKFVHGIRHQDVIGHPNVVAVIIDGNLLRIMEAVHYSVPIIGISMLAEQKSNMARVKRDKYGVEINFQEFTGEELYEAVMDVLHNPEYKRNVEAKTKVMNDRLVSAIDTALYWVEYLSRHGGAEHLQSPGVHLNLFKRRSVDIILVLTLIDIIIFLIFYYIFKHIFKCCIKKCANRKAKKYSTLTDDSENSSNIVS